MKTTDGAEKIARLSKLGEHLNRQLLIAVYGKKLADTPAVKELETYHRYCSQNIFDPVEDNCVEEAPYPFDLSDTALSMFREAMIKLDAQFFEDFAAAIRRRKDPAYADRFKVIDYIHKQWLDMHFARTRGPIENDELKALGLKNVSRTVTQLGLDACIKDHTDRRGKPRKSKK